MRCTSDGDWIIMWISAWYAASYSVSTTSSSSQIRRAASASRSMNAVIARRICDEDDVIDQLYDAAYHALIQEVIRTPADVQRITYLIWTSHNLERIADRVTNICERVIFMVTGVLEEINVSRY